MREHLKRRSDSIPSRIGASEISRSGSIEVNTLMSNLSSFASTNHIVVELMRGSSKRVSFHLGNDVDSVAFLKGNIIRADNLLRREVQLGIINEMGGVGPHEHPMSSKRVAK